MPPRVVAIFSLIELIFIDLCIDRSSRIMSDSLDPFSAHSPPPPPSCFYCGTSSLVVVLSCKAYRGMEARTRLCAVVLLSQVTFVDMLCLGHRHDLNMKVSQLYFSFD
jgi:hypothetical protein